MTTHKTPVQLYRTGTTDQILGTETCSNPLVGWREWQRVDGSWHFEYNCARCGWIDIRTIPASFNYLGK